MQKKSYLIVTASIGSGHVKAAEAIEHELKRRYPAANVYTVDFMARETSLLNWLMKEIYLKMLAFVPNLYEFLYKFSGGHTGGTLVQRVLAFVMQWNMAGLIRKYQPQTVICTHPFPEGAASCLKKTGRYDFLFATVMTDFSVHQIWLYPAVDLFFVATEKMKQDLLQAGFAAAKIHVVGIPIECPRKGRCNRQGILRRLKLDPEVPVLLLMGGGLGLGGIDAALAELEKLTCPVQFLVVAGKNKALADRARELAAASTHKILVWGYTNEVPEFMLAATLLISKPGALTISEALAMQVPLLLHEPIPGPETENAIYVSERGAAVWIRPGDDLLQIVSDLLRSPERQQAMREAAAVWSRPDAAKDMVKKLEPYVIPEK